MAQQIHPTPLIDVEIGGKVRSLRFDLNAMVRAERERFKETGMWMPITKIMQREEIGFLEVRILLWATLLHEDPELSIDEVGAWCGPSALGYIAEKIAEAFIEQSVVQEGEDGTGPDPTRTKAKKEPVRVSHG